MFRLSVAPLVILAFLSGVFISDGTSAYRVRVSKPIHQQQKRHKVTLHLVRRITLLRAGIASWYSRESSGSTTASGEPMRDDLKTCAMLGIPVPSSKRSQTIVLVKNVENGLSTTCRVNDRGPAVSTGRVIDLSMATRNALRAGDLTRVRVYKVSVH